MSTRKPYMPNVDNLSMERLGEIFNRCHANSSKHRCMIMLSPGRLAQSFFAPAANTMASNAEESMQRILPLPPKRVVAIGFTADLLHAETTAVTAAIPFWGFLIGLVYIGHSVVLFEGHPLAFEFGVRGTDMLLVDSDMTAFLPSHWTETAFRVMRTPEVNVFNSNNPQESRVQRIINPTDNLYNRQR